MVRYEDLIKDPQVHGSRLMEFLGLDFNPAQLEFHKNDSIVEHAGISDFWKNLAKPIDAGNSGKYRNSLRPREIEVFESVAWQEMKLLGYSLDSSRRKHISLPEMAMFKVTTAWRRKLARSSGSDEMNRRNQRNALLRPVIERSFDA